MKPRAVDRFVDATATSPLVSDVPQTFKSALADVPSTSDSKSGVETPSAAAVSAAGNQFGRTRHLVDAKQAPTSSM